MAAIHAAILKNKKIAISPQHLTDIDQIWQMMHLG